MVNAATENLGLENGLLGEFAVGDCICTDEVLLLFVLLTVPIRESVAGGRLIGLIGNRSGAGCCPLRLSDAIESRIPPSLLPAFDIGGVMGAVVDFLNFRGCGKSGFEAVGDTSVGGCDDELGVSRPLQASDAVCIPGEDIE